MFTESWEGVSDQQIQSTTEYPRDNLTLTNMIRDKKIHILTNNYMSIIVINIVTQTWYFHLIVWLPEYKTSFGSTLE